MPYRAGIDVSLAPPLPVAPLPAAPPSPSRRYDWAGMVPFVLLLQRKTKRSPRLLSGVATALLVLRLVDVFWLVKPAFTPAALEMSFMDVSVPLGLGGVWVYVFVRELGRRGSITAAAHQVAANVAVFVFMVPLALGNATGVLVGQSLGAGDGRRARHAGVRREDWVAVLNDLRSGACGKEDGKRNGGKSDGAARPADWSNVLASAHCMLHRASAQC